MYVPDFETRDLKPAGEWNQSEIIFDNGHVTYLLNGKVTVEFDAWTPDWFARKNAGKWDNAPEYGLARRGVICLQDHGYPAWFRNIKIKELPSKSEEEDLFNGKDLSGWVNYGTELWYVDEDGCLVCESGPDKGYGYLGTEKYYGDFDLDLEFKQEANGNSGVFIRSTELRHRRHLRILRPRLAGADSRGEGKRPQGRRMEPDAHPMRGRPRPDLAERRAYG